MTAIDSAMAAPSLLALLRAETAPAHRTLDAALDFSPRTLSAERYAAFLLGTWQVVRGLEPAITQVIGDAGLPPLARPRRAVLEADLAALGVVPAPAFEVTLPRSPAAGWGAAYVLEGSSLGGLVLAKRVREILGARIADEATAYLHLRGEDTKRSWTAFQASLAAFDARASADERAESCAMARTIFELYARAFAQTAALSASPHTEAAS